MASQWDEWLRELRAAGKGGVVAKAIDRGLPYSYAMSIPLDVSGDTFTASLRMSPDAPDPTLADFTVVVGAYTAGATIVTLSLGETETEFADVADIDGVAGDLVFDVLRNGQRFLAGVVRIAGMVTPYA